MKLPPQVADKVATAFAHTFWWAVGTILIAFIPTLFLPSKAAAPPGPPAGPPPDPDALTTEDDDRSLEVPPVVGR